MSELEVLKKDFQKKISAQVDLISEGVGRYRVFTPFRFRTGITFRLSSKKRINIGFFPMRATP